MRNSCSGPSGVQTEAETVDGDDPFISGFLIRAERVYRLNEPDGADGDQIVLLVGLGVILF